MAHKKLGECSVETPYSVFHIHIRRWLRGFPDISLDQSIKLDIPEGDYFLTTIQENDIDAMQEILSIDSISDELVNVPKPYDIKISISNKKSTVNCAKILS